MSKLKTAGGAVALALVLFGMSGGAEADAATPPPPPIDWDATPVDFPPFWVIGPNPAPGVLHTVEYAANPEEGRALCLYDQQYDDLGPSDCRVEPISAGPDITQDGWLNDWAGQNGFPVIGGAE